MIKIYDKNKSFIKQIDIYKDMKIEKEVNMLHLLFFHVPNQLGGLFEEEGYIETKDHGRFVIKEKNIGQDSIEIVGKYDLEDLDEWVESKAYITETVEEMMIDLLEGSGWEVISSISVKRTVTGTNMSLLSFIKKIVETFKAEIVFDNQAKFIRIGEELGDDKGVYFHDELNLKRINISSDSHDFATRLIPVGFNDMGIELINEGKPYVENHKYSNKIKTVYWKDERYTNVENLKEDGIKKLSELAKPRRSYSADVANLAKASEEEYSILDYDIGDTITLVNKNTKTREKQRIMKLVHYPNNPLLDTVEIENRPRIWGEKDREEINNLRESFNITKASLELFEDRIEGKVTKVEGNVEDLKSDLILLEDGLADLIEDGKIIISDEEPHEGKENQLWIDISTEPKKFYIYLDGEWSFIGDDLNEIYNNLDNLSEELGGLVEDLFDFKEETEAIITENSAQLGILSDEISTKVSQTEYDSNYNELNNNYTEFRQDYESFINTIQVGGGNNLILNSVGYGSLNFWTLISGNVNYGNDSTWILKGTSKHGWVISNGEMEQVINLPAEKNYILSGRMKKYTNSGTVSIGLYEGNNLLHEVMDLGNEVYDGEFSYEFKTSEDSELRLVIKVVGVSTVNPLELTDLMLAQGENYNYWSQANGESYTLNVKVDGKGVEVYSVDGQGKTVMSPEEFAGYYADSRVFTVNRDITEVVGMLIKDKGLHLPPIKFVQTSVSVDVVYTGR